MTIVDFQPLPALLGGVLIGLSALLLMASIGRIAGISGIIGNLIRPLQSLPWHWLFVVGMLMAGAIAHYSISPLPLEINTSSSLMIIAGLLVGFGTRLGSGCTSGHGVCGLSRFSRRSIVATLTFMLTAVITVAIMGYWQ